MNTGRIIADVAGAAILIVALSAAWAQTPGGAGSPGGRTGQGSSRPPASVERGPGPNAAAADIAEQARIQLRDLEEDLRLTQAQRIAWVAFADKVQKLADDVIRARNAVRFPKGAAPEQLEFVADTLRNRLTAIEDIVEAGKSCYAGLTPEQKTIADGRLARIPIPLIAPSQSIAASAAREMRPGDAPAGAPRGR